MSSRTEQVAKQSWVAEQKVGGLGWRDQLSSEEMFELLSVLESSIHLSKIQKLTTYSKEWPTHIRPPPPKIILLKHV